MTPLPPLLFGLHELALLDRLLSGERTAAWLAWDTHLGLPKAKVMLEQLALRTAVHSRLVPRGAAWVELWSLTEWVARYLARPRRKWRREMVESSA